MVVILNYIRKIIIGIELSYFLVRLN